MCNVEEVFIGVKYANIKQIMRVDLLWNQTHLFLLPWSHGPVLCALSTRGLFYGGTDL